MDNSDWSVLPYVYRHIICEMGQPSWDIFCTRANCKGKDGGFFFDEAQDAWKTLWPRAFLWVNPPFKQWEIIKTVARLLADEHHGILVVPDFLFAFCEKLLIDNIITIPKGKNVFKHWSHEKDRYIVGPVPFKTHFIKFRGIPLKERISKQTLPPSVAEECWKLLDKQEPELKDARIEMRRQMALAREKSIRQSMQRSLIKTFKKRTHEQHSAEARKRLREEYEETQAMIRSVEIDWDRFVPNQWSMVTDGDLQTEKQCLPDEEDTVFIEESKKKLY